MRALLAACLLICAACHEANAPAQPVAETALNGIDLSHHNGAVDWTMLSAAPIDFIYLKATEGRDWKDPRFQDNWNNALKSGFRTGAYHFYLLCKSGRAQADNFIQSVEVRADTLPPAIDLEYAGNCTPDQPAENVRAEIDVFLTALEAEYGQPPVIYTTQSFYADWIAGRFDPHAIWIRKIGDRAPTLPDGRDWTIWQYDMRGQISGIDGPVDLNHAKSTRLDARQ